MRKALIKRKTTETDIVAKINIDGTGLYKVNTKFAFFDHMIEQLAKHSLMDIELTCKGDGQIDAHHSVEDCGYALGEAINQALADKMAINRYGFAYVPMDDALTRCVIDFCSRPYLVWSVGFQNEKIGNMDTEVFREFFVALSVAGGANLHIENLYGINTHHIIESCFKATAKAIKQAVQIDKRQRGVLPSTKGKL